MFGRKFPPNGHSEQSGHYYILCRYIIHTYLLYRPMQKRKPAQIKSDVKEKVIEKILINCKLLQNLNSKYYLAIITRDTFCGLNTLKITFEI